MENTTIRITKDLRDTIKIGALYKKMTVERYLSWLVQADLGLHHKQAVLHANNNT